MKLTETVLVLAMACAATAVSAAPKADIVPGQLGFAGSFSHRGGDQFEFNLPSGVQLVVGRSGEVVSLEAGSALVIRDSDGRPLRVLSKDTVLYNFAYNQAGQLSAIRPAGGEAFRIAYTRGKKLISILFPNKQKARFPVDEEGP